MKILVTGANGQLGSEIRELSKGSPHRFIFCGSKELDITDKQAVQVIFSREKVDVLLNCAAYTAVDKAESEKTRALLVNEDGCKNLAESCKTHNVVMVNVSTDYVFDGKNYSPYQEEQKTNPIGFYGYSKLKGEEAITRSSAKAVTIRTAWVYSSYGSNFVKTMLKLGKEREKLTVIEDQIGSPTYARDLGKFMLYLIDDEEFMHAIGGHELLHFSNRGVASWYDFARAIMELKLIECEIKPIPTSAFPTPAKRPAYSVLSKLKVEKSFPGFEIPDWRVSLKACLKRM